MERLWSRTLRAPNGCLEWQGCRRKESGHGQIKLNGWAQSVHRVAWELQHGPVPKGQVLRHRCDNPICVDVAHLELGTHADNVRDRVERGRSAVGISNGRSKLTERQVRNIKRKLAADPTASTVALGKHYGVDSKVIRDIRAGKTWRHVK